MAIIFPPPKIAIFGESDLVRQIAESRFSVRSGGAGFDRFRLARKTARSTPATCLPRSRKREKARTFLGVRIVILGSALRHGITEDNPQRN